MKNKGNAAAGIVIVFIFIIILIVGYFFIKNYINKDNPKIDNVPTTGILFSVINSDTGAQISATGYLEDQDLGYKKDAIITSETTMTLIDVPQNRTYKLYFIADGYYESMRGFFILFSQSTTNLGNISIYPHAEKLSMSKIGTFIPGENSIVFSVKAEDGWLRRASICLAWSPAFIYAEIDPYLLRCDSQWKTWPDLMYSCDSPSQESIGCSYLRDFNTTCVLDTLRKPQRLFTKTDACYKIEETLSSGENFNFTVKYKLLGNPKALDYLRFYVIDRDKTKESNWNYVYENLAGQDVAMQDQMFEFFVLNN